METNKVMTAVTATPTARRVISVERAAAFGMVPAPLPPVWGFKAGVVIWLEVETAGVFDVRPPPHAKQKRTPASDTAPHFPHTVTFVNGSPPSTRHTRRQSPREGVRLILAFEPG